VIRLTNLRVPSVGTIVRAIHELPPTKACDSHVFKRVGTRGEHASPHRTGTAFLHRTGTTSVPLRKNPGPTGKTSEGPACQVRVLEFRRDLLVRSACWDSGRTCFSTQNKHSQRSPVGAIHELPPTKAYDCHMFKRVGTRGGTCFSTQNGHCFFAQNGHDKRAPPQKPRPHWKNLGGTCLTRPRVEVSEGPACQVRVF